MNKKEIVGVNLFPSDMEIPSELPEHDKNLLLNSVYGSLKKHIATMGFAIFPHRPGVRFFVDSDEAITIDGKEHCLVQVENWRGEINQVRFHDGFLSQIEVIDSRIWLKIDPRQAVLIKGNEQDNRDFNRSFYVSYCPFSTCENRSKCLLARPKGLREVHFSEDKEGVTSLREIIGVGCGFYRKLKDVNSVIEAKWGQKSILVPWGMIYFKGGITDMPNSRLRKVYWERCLLKSKKRLMLTRFAFSVLSDKKDSIRIQHQKNGISFKNMFEGEVNF